MVLAFVASFWSGLLAVVMPILQPVLTIGGLAIGGALAHRIVRVGDAEKAQLLSRIAADGAKLLIRQYPNSPFPQLLELLVNMISSAAGVPVTNRDAITRAAAGALHDVGVAS